jgi:hypothetical protein
LLIEANLLVARLFASARRFLQRDFQLHALLREGRQRLGAVYYHRYQDRLDGSPQSPHLLLGRFELARLHRTRDQQRMLQTGKGYWQLHDIEEMARHMRGLERDKSPELSLMWERIPSSAIPQLNQRMTELRRAEERARDADSIAALDTAYAAAADALDRGDTSVLFFGAPLAPQFRR